MSATTAANEFDIHRGANDRQVGGDHYKTGGEEHWDLMHDCDVPYLLGCASKYIARHHLKDGRAALEKAIHYQEKWLEKVGPQTSFRDWRVAPDDLLAWAEAAGLRAAEIRILQQMLCWRRVPAALKLTRDFLERRYPAGAPACVKLPDPLESEHRPGTPEDGGHYARQPQEDDEEELIRYTVRGPFPLPGELSHHQWAHHCDKLVQCCYELDTTQDRYRKTRTLLEASAAHF